MADLYDESYDDRYARQQQEQERQAREAAMHAERANSQQVSFGYGNGHWGMYQNRDAMNYAAREAHQAQQAAEMRSYDEQRRQQQFEKQLLRAEAERRQFDSETGRYGAETNRIGVNNQHKAQMGAVGAMHGMNAAVGNMASGFGGSQQTPNINLYGAGGQRIGGSAMGRSPLASLMDR